jgi:hypothetical protein
LPIFIPTPLTPTPLGASDEDLLFGRAAEIETIVGNCRAGRLTVITAPPGVGASSLLRAGAVPALQRAGFITVVYADWQGPSFETRFTDAILTAIRDQADSEFTVVQESLLDLLAKAEAMTGKPLAVLLDQFEDYLRWHTGTDIAEKFDADLANAVSTRAGRFVIGLQNHSVGKFERLDSQIPNLMGFTINLPPLTVEAAKQLVCRSASLAGIEMEESAADLLIAAPVALVAADANNPAGVHPLFVKLGAARLIDAELNLKSKVARASTVRANGGADRMILESLDFPLRQLGRANRKLLFRWFPLLVSPEGRRIAVAEKALVGNSAQWNRPVPALLPLLLKGGLMRTVSTPRTRSELARESATVVVWDWWKRQDNLKRRARIRLMSFAAVLVVVFLVYLFVGVMRP